ncbi:hypothetical protein ACFWTC_03165 [Streptomyces sp. NPDC058619]
MNNLAPGATPDPIPAWETTGQHLAQEDRAWDLWEQDHHDTDND